MGDDFRWVKEPREKSLEEMTWWEIIKGIAGLLFVISPVFLFGSCAIKMMNDCYWNDKRPEQRRMLVYESAEQHFMAGEIVEAYAVANHVYEDFYSKCGSAAESKAKRLMQRLEEIMTAEELVEAKEAALRKGISE